MNVIPLYATRAAKAHGVGIAAGVHALAQGLTPIQTRAVMRYARERYTSGGASPARAVADARNLAASHMRGGAA